MLGLLGVSICIAAGIAGTASAATLTFTSVDTSFGVAGSIQIADVNGDGKNDLLFTNPFNGPLEVALHGDGATEFSAPPAQVSMGSNPHGLSVADLNDDGNLDVVVANSVSPTSTPIVTYRLGNGDGTFGPVASLARPTGANLSTPQETVLADINADGKQDLIVGGSGGSIRVYLGDGMGGFDGGATVGAGGLGGTAIVARELTGDSHVDLAIANRGTPGTCEVPPRNCTSVPGNVTILPGDGAGGFGAAVATLTTTGNPHPANLAAANFDSTNTVDLVTADLGRIRPEALFGTTASVFLSAGAGAFDGYTLPVGSGPRGIDTADFNLDGKQDIVVANQADDAARVFLGDGAGGFQVLRQTMSVDTTEFAEQPNAVVTGDLNGDSRPDFVAPAVQAAPMRLWINTTTPTDDPPAAGGGDPGDGGGNSGPAGSASPGVPGDVADPGAIRTPSSVFSIGGLRRARDGGITLVLDLPGAGALDVLATTNVRGARRSRGARRLTFGRARRNALAAGRVRVTIRPSRKARTALRRERRLRVSLRITFTPTGGTPRVQRRSVTVRLAKRR